MDHQLESNRVHPSDALRLAAGRKSRQLAPENLVAGKVGVWCHTASKWHLLRERNNSLRTVCGQLPQTQNGRRSFDTFKVWSPRLDDLDGPCQNCTEAKRRLYQDHRSLDTL